MGSNNRDNLDQGRSQYSPRQGRSLKRLSDAVLEEHEILSAKHDGRYAEALIRAEAAQLYEQAMAPDDILLKNHGEDGDRLHLDVPVAASLESIQKLYRPPQSSAASPMERWLTVSPANEQSPWLAKRAMSDSAIALGSLETLGMRVEDAILRCEEKNAGKESTESSAIVLTARQPRLVRRTQRARDRVGSKRAMSESDALLEPSTQPGNLARKVREQRTY